MTSAILDTPDDDSVLAGLQAEDAQCETWEGSADPTESFVQNTFGPTTDIPFAEGRPWSPPAPDPVLAAFQKHIRQAEGFERQIADIERTADELLADTKGQFAPLKKQEIVACFEAWKLVSDGKIPVSVMEEYALAVNVKAHGNAKIPCSRLMRAVIATGLTEGTPTPQRKLARASTYASAIDYGIREGMSTEAFTAELDQSRKRGEHYGIEYLAAKGREVRKNANTDQSGDEIARALVRCFQNNAPMGVMLHCRFCSAKCGRLARD